MSILTKEFTKEQLIEQAKKNIEVLRGAAERIPGASDAAVIHLKLAEITLASLEAKPIGAFHISDQQVDGTTDYIKDGEWPTDNGTIEVYAAPPAQINDSLPGGFSVEEARSLQADLVRSHISKALSGEKMKSVDKNADLQWIHGVIVRAAWFVKASVEATAGRINREI